jgi:hypothetical protein
MEKHIQIDAPSPDNTKKKLKKYARREARAMQALEQARRDLQKAEQKLTRATRNLQEHQASLHVCEDTLQEVRSARRAFQTSMGTRSEIGPQETSGEGASLRMTATAPGMTEISGAEEGTVKMIAEVLSDLADAETAVARATNESAEEQKLPPDQPAFDANETVVIDQSEMAETLAGDNFLQSDENATRDPADPGTEQSPTTAPTHKATTRRPRSSTPPPARPTATRRRTPSNRASSNKEEKMNDEENA